MSGERFWPTPAQQLLLGMCLHRDPALAVRCWHAWKEQTDLDDLEPSCFQIMSLVYLRLVDLGVADAELGRIKGLHRYRWTQGQVAFRGKRALLTALAEEGIPAMLLRGAALAATVYPEAGARGIQDTEVVVPMGSVAEAISKLERHGWVARSFEPNGSVEKWCSCPLLHAEHGEVYLQWRVLRSQCKAQDEIWEAAGPLRYEGISTHAPCAADQLLHACEHGMHPWSQAGLQWLADCLYLIRSREAEMDWERVLVQSRKFQLTLYVRGALEYLREHFEESIPREVIAALGRCAAPIHARIDYHLAGRPAEKQNDLAHKLAAAACRYLKMQGGGRLRELRQDLRRLPALISRGGLRSGN